MPHVETFDPELERAHRRMDDVERRVQQLRQNTAPTVPQYDLQATASPLPNFVNWSFDDVTVGCSFGQAQIGNSYALFLSEWDTPYPNGTFGGPFDSPVSSPTPTISMGVTWDSSTTGIYKYGGGFVDVTNPLPGAPFVVILARDLSGIYQPIGIGVLQQGQTGAVDYIGLDGIPTITYDGLDTVTATFSSVPPTRAYRLLNLKRNGTFGGAPFGDHFGSGGSWTQSMDLSSEGYAIGATFAILLTEYDDNSGTAFANADGHFPYVGTIFTYGTAGSGINLTDFTHL